MRHFFRYLWLACMLTFVTDLVAQTTKWQAIHEVKRKETIFGISRNYGLTVQELIEANPILNTPGYELKKGEVLNIPYPKTKPQTATPQPKTATAAVTSSKSSVSTSSASGKKLFRLGVLLPLHDINGDGKRMVEYYRGVLMACDSLKKTGVSVDVRAWNCAEDADAHQLLQSNGASDCDLIIGPLYSKQMNAVSEFSVAHDIKILIPFSINAPQLYANRNIYQVFQNANDINENTIQRFMQQFKGYHPVFIDCNDTTSRKGIFTFNIRRRMEAAGIEYSLTNLKSSDALFQRAFSTTQRNIVVLNTGRSQELSVAFAKINNVKMNVPELQISMFGYPEWVSYTRQHMDNFYRYDTYIPTAFYTNPASAQYARFQQKYRSNFHADMMRTLPRFAMTGFDHTMYFVKGMLQYGKDFTGAIGMVGYTPFQTPLHFERVANGGLQNKALLFVHYTPDHRVETVNF